MSEAYEIDWLPPNDYKEYWQTKDFELIKYSDMTDKHLINAYNMVSGNIIRFVNRCMSQNEEQDLPEWVENAIIGLEKELLKRGLLEQ